MGRRTASSRSALGRAAVALSLLAGSGLATVVAGSPASGVSPAPTTPAASTTGVVCPVAGNGWPRGANEFGGNVPTHVAVDGPGTTIFWHDAGNDDDTGVGAVVRWQGPGGRDGIFAGGGPRANRDLPGTSGTSANFGPIVALATERDPATGEAIALYVAQPTTVRRIDVATRQVTTVAGVAGDTGFVSTTGLASSLPLGEIGDLAWGGPGVLYVLSRRSTPTTADDPSRVYRVDVATGVVTLAIGAATPTGNFTVDQIINTSQQASRVHFRSNRGLAFNRTTSVLFVLDDLGRLVSVSAGGTATVRPAVQSSPGAANSADAPSAIVQRASTLAATGSSVYYAEPTANLVGRISGGAATVLAGSGRAGFGGDGAAAIGPAALAASAFATPLDIDADDSGALYVADSLNHRIRRLVTGNGALSTVAPEFAGPGVEYVFGAPATDPQLAAISGIAADDAGGIYVIDDLTNRLLYVDPSGDLQLLTGSGKRGFVNAEGVAGYNEGDENNSALGRELAAPGTGGSGLVRFSRRGTDRWLYFATDLGPDGFSTLASVRLNEFNQFWQYRVSTATSVRRYTDYAVDGAGNVYLTGPDGIVYVQPDAGAVAPWAGTGSVAPYDPASTGGDRLAVGLGHLTKIDVGPDGRVYVVSDGSRLLRIDPVTGAVDHIAGAANPAGVSDGSGGPALDAHLAVTALKVAAGPTVLLGEGNRIRRLAGTRQASDVVTDVIANGAAPVDAFHQNARSEMPLLNAAVAAINAIDVDASGRIVFADDAYAPRDLSLPGASPVAGGNHLVRRVDGGCDTYASVETTTAESTQLVLANSAIAAGTTGRVYFAEATADLRYVAFTADGTLGLGGTVDAINVYLLDRTDGRIRLVNQTAEGLPDFSGLPKDPSLVVDRHLDVTVRDGHVLVAFPTDGALLINGSASTEIVVKDMTTGALTVASNDGVAPLPGPQTEPSFNADGTKLAFKDRQRGSRSYIADLLSPGTAPEVGAASGGGASNGTTQDVRFSLDGRYAVYQTTGTNLGTTQTLTGQAEIVRETLQGGAKVVVSLDADGVPSNALTEQPYVSAEGRYVGYTLAAAGNIDVAAGAIVRDMVTGRNTNLFRLAGAPARSGRLKAMSPDAQHFVVEAFVGTIRRTYLLDRSGAAPHWEPLDVLANGDDRGVLAQGLGTEPFAFLAPAAIDDSGRRVAFVSRHDLTGGNQPGTPRLYVRDTHRVSLDPPYTAERELTPVSGTDATVRIARFGPAESIYYLTGSELRRRAADGTVTTYGDSQVAGAYLLAVAPDGTVYLSEGTGVWQVTTDGHTSRLTGFATSRPFGGLAVDPTDGRPVVTLDTTVAKVRADGVGVTIIGSGVAACGDGPGPATAVALCDPGAVAVDAQGNVAVADGLVDRAARGRVRLLDAATGVVSTLAGSDEGRWGFYGANDRFEEDDVPAGTTALGHVDDLVFGADGSLLVTQANERRIRRVAPDGIVTTVVNGGGATPPFDGPATTLDVGPNGEIILSDGTTGLFQVVGMTVDLSVDRPTAEPGVSVVPTRVIPPQAIDVPPTAPAGSTLAAVGIGEVGPEPLRDGLQASPLRGIPLRGIPLRGIPLRGIPLRGIPIDFPGGWDALLAGTPLAGKPLEAVSLADAFDPLVNTNLNTHNGRDLNDLTLGALDLSGTPLRGIALAAIALSGTPLRGIPLPATVPGDTNDERWCNLLVPLIGTCLGLDVPATADGVTLLDASIAGVPLRGIPLRGIPLRGIPLRGIDLEAIPLRGIPLRGIDLEASPLRGIPLRGIVLAPVPLRGIPLRGIPLRGIPLRGIDLEASPLRGIPLRGIANAASLVDCARVDCTETSDATLGTAADLEPTAITAAADLGALVAAVRGPELDDMTLGDLKAYGDVEIGDLFDAIVAMPEADTAAYTFEDLLKTLLPLQDYPWEALDLGETAELHTAATAPGAGGQAPQVLTYTTTVQVAATGLGLDLDLDFALPFGFTYVPGSAAKVHTPEGGTPVRTALGAPRSTSPLRLHADGVVTGDRVEIQLVAGLELGVRDATVTVRGTNVPLVRTATLASAVSGEWEEQNGTVASATPIGTDRIYLPHLATGTDVDVFSLDVADGDSISAILSNLPADFDLTLYAPPPPLVVNRSADRFLVPVADEGVGLGGVTPAPADVADDIPLESARVVQAVSQRRGTGEERIDTGRLRGGRYYLKVTGYNGASSTLPYALRVTTQPIAPPPACAAWSFTTATAERGSLPTVTDLAGANTLFLVNRERLFGRFGPSGGATVMSSLASFVTATSARPEWGVRAAVVAVDGDPAVHAANLAWDADRCGPGTAKALSGAIATVVDGIRAGHPTVTNVVVVGGDDVLPFGRIADTTRLANERDYASTFPTNDELTASLRNGWVLTDDVYVDPRPTQVGPSELHVPTAAVGRLVETPADIAGALADFVTNEGHLDARTALSVGYDFLKDGSSEVRDELAANGLTVSANATALISDTWTAAALREALLGGTVPDVAALNAHYDHFRVLPADENTAGSQANLFRLSDVTASGLRTLARSLLFSIGCHSGLSVSDATAGGLGADWAQTYAAQGAVWLGNTGFGYGDTDVVAVSERLMALFAKALDGSMTAGQALLVAKQRYVGGLGEIVTPYDVKVSQEMAYYGLPMYRLRATPTALPAAPVAPAAAPEPRTGLDAAPLTITPAFDPPHVVDRGSYWTVGGDALTVQNRPIQPRTTVDVSRLDATGATVADARGMLVTGLTSVDTGPQIDPVLFRPIVDSADEREPAATESVFPAAPVGIGAYDDLVAVGGDATLVHRQQVVAVPGQFRSAGQRGVQRLYPSLSGLVYYAAPGDSDRTAPTVSFVTASVTADGAAFTVRATDAGTGVRRVFVLAAPADPTPGATVTWFGVDLAPAGGDRWSGTVALPAGTTAVEYLVQVVDGSGNVAVSSNKGVDYRTATASTSGPAAPTITATPALTPGAWLRGTVSLVAADPQGLPMSYQVDGRTILPVDGPIVVSGSGLHEVVVRNAGGLRTTLYVPIDDDAPVVRCAPAPSGWSNVDVAVPCGAADAGAGMVAGDASFALVATAPAGSETTTASTGTRQVCDVLGSCATAGPVTGIRIDRRAPDVASALDGRSFGAGTVLPTPAFGCSDAGSGVATCALEAGTALDTATVGVHTFTVVATDVAGNTTRVTFAYTVTSGAAAPSVAADPLVPNGGGGWFVAAPTVTVRATAAASNPPVTSVQYTLSTTAGSVSGTIVNTTGADPFVTTLPAATAQGTTTYTFRAVGSGPTSPDGTVVVRLDSIAPDATCTAPPALTADGWYADNPTVTCTVTDAGSGPVTPAAGFPAAVAADTADGAAAVPWTVADVAGNTRSGTTVVRVDRQAPTITAPAPQDAVTGAYVVGQAATVTCGDGTGSGIATCTPAALDVSTPGTRTVALSATDQVGNATTRSLTYTVRAAVAPTVTLTRSPAAPTGANGWYTVAVTVAATATAGDFPLAGPVQLTVRGAPVAGSSAVVSAQGSSVVVATATDSAGNSAAATVTVEVDTVAPSITAIAPAGGTTLPVGQAASLTYTASDVTSGIASCSPASGSAIDTATTGTRTITIACTDLAGNVGSSVVTYTVAAASGWTSTAGTTFTVADDATVNFATTPDARLFTNLLWRTARAPANRTGSATGVMQFTQTGSSAARGSGLFVGAKRTAAGAVTGGYTVQFDPAYSCALRSGGSAIGAIVVQQWGANGQPVSSSPVACATVPTSLYSSALAAALDRNRRFWSLPLTYTVTVTTASASQSRISVAVAWSGAGRSGTINLSANVATTSLGDWWGVRAWGDVTGGFRSAVFRF